MGRRETKYRTRALIAGIIFGFVTLTLAPATAVADDEPSTAKRALEILGTTATMLGLTYTDPMTRFATLAGLMVYQSGDITNQSRKVVRFWQRISELRRGQEKKTFARVLWDAMNDDKRTRREIMARFGSAYGVYRRGFDELERVVEELPGLLQETGVHAPTRLKAALESWKRRHSLEPLNTWVESEKAAGSFRHAALKSWVARYTRARNDALVDSKILAEQLIQINRDIHSRLNGADTSDFQAIANEPGRFALWNTSGPKEYGHDELQAYVQGRCQSNLAQLVDHGKFLSQLALAGYTVHTGWQLYKRFQNTDAAKKEQIARQNKINLVSVSDLVLDVMRMHKQDVVLAIRRYNETDPKHPIKASELEPRFAPGSVLKQDIETHVISVVNDRWNKSPLFQSYVKGDALDPDTARRVGRAFLQDLYRAILADEILTTDASNVDSDTVDELAEATLKGMSQVKLPLPSNQSPTASATLPPSVPVDLSKPVSIPTGDKVNPMPTVLGDPQPPALGQRNKEPRAKSAASMGEKSEASKR